MEPYRPRRTDALIDIAERIRITGMACSLTAERTAFGTDNGRSARAAGTALRAPFSDLAQHQPKRLRSVDRRPSAGSPKARNPRSFLSRVEADWRAQD